MSNFFKKPAFGLDISDYSIEVLELGSRLKVQAFGRIVLEPGIVKNGMILDKKKLTEKIKKVISQAKIKSNQVVLSLPESKVFIHIFQTPKGLKGKTLKYAIAFEAPKIIPLEQQKIYWDCQIVSSLPKATQQSVLYVATFKKIINGYIDVLNEIGLKPVVFEMESIALGRALLESIKPQNSLVIVDIGARTTNINIFNKNKELRWTSSVSVAGNQFTKAISEKLNISLDQAEELKKEQGLNEGSKTVLILQKELQPIIQEIKEILHYYKEQIDEIFLAGGSAQIPDIVPYLSLNTEKKVSLGKSLITKQLKGESILYNTVIGLALRALKGRSVKLSINLLPEKIKTRAKFSFVSEKRQDNKFLQVFAYVFPLLSLAFLGWVIINYTPKAPKFEYLQGIAPTTQQAASEPEALESEIVLKETEQSEIEPVKAVSEEEPQPQPEASLEVEQEKIIQAVIQPGISRLNVRQGPGTNYPIIAKVHSGEAYPLLQEQDEWCKIKVKENQEGWLFAKYVSLKEVVSGEEIVKEQITQQIIIKQTSAGRLNVRGGPGTNYPIITKVHSGEAYPLLQEQGEWYKINIGEDQQGWVFTSYVLKQ